MKTCLLTLCALLGAAFGFSACGGNGDIGTSVASTSSPATTVPVPTNTVASPASTVSAGGSAAVDLKNLPVGDGKYASSAKAGSIFKCQQTFNGGGAFATGAWMHADSTFDVTAKPTVDGSVSWPHSFTVTMEGESRVLKGNELPDHNTGTFPIGSADDAYNYDRNPNSIRAQTLSLMVPAAPSMGATPSCIRGTVGIMLSGSLLFDGLDAGGRDAVAHEIQDSCGGHPQMTGVYHYHSLSSCISAGPAGKHSELVGYALDGFGIYGNAGEGGTALTNADLDECHGHTHSITWDSQPVVMYHYHTTAEYPYSVGCFRGSKVANLN